MQHPFHDPPPPGPSNADIISGTEMGAAAGKEIGSRGSLEERVCECEMGRSVAKQLVKFSLCASLPLQPSFPQPRQPNTQYEQKDT